MIKYNRIRINGKSLVLIIVLSHLLFSPAVFAKTPLLPLQPSASVHAVDEKTFIKTLAVNLKAGTATKEDCIKGLKIIFKPIPEAIPSILGIFNSRVGMGDTLKQAFLYTLDSWTKKL